MLFPLQQIFGATKLAKTKVKLYVPVVAISTEDNSKLLQQLKSGFNQTYRHRFKTSI